MTVPCDDADGLAATQISTWLSAAARQIATANKPGNLDGLFARYILASRTVTGLEWDVSPLSERWLEDNRNRLDDAPALAALGYGLTYSGPGKHAEARAALAIGLPRLTGRDPFRDSLTFVNYPLHVLGIGLAARTMAAQLPEVAGWLTDVLQNPQLRQAGRFRELIYQHVRVLLSGKPVPAENRAEDEVANLAMLHWMADAGTLHLAGSADEHRALRKRIISETLHIDPAALTVPHAAVLYRALTAILDESIDQVVLSRSHLGEVLRRFPAAMRRWRWDSGKLTHPIRWQIRSEREVQDILWLILRSVFDDLVDEETLPKFGQSSYKADFGLPRLGVLIEVKYARNAADFKRIQEEVMVDSIGYLHRTGPYKEIVVFIYDASASVQEHAITEAALRELDGVSDVVLISRPGQLGAIT